MTKKKEIWVVKIGSQLLVDEGPLLIRALVKDIASLKRKHHIDVVWVTSGAIATARSQLEKNWKTLPEKQALSAIGQPLLMELYNTAFAFNGLRAAQVLLTASDLKRGNSRKNLYNTIRQLLAWDVVPILNENDAVATEEIQFGDNDHLSALVAGEIKAQRLVILTNVEGLYDRDPRDPNAQLTHQLEKISSPLLAKLKKATGSKLGRGGIFSKILAAQEAGKNAISTSIVKGSRPHVLLELASGQKVGTLIKAPSKKLRRS